MQKIFLFAWLVFDAEGEAPHEGPSTAPRRGGGSLPARRPRLRPIHRRGIPMQGRRRERGQPIFRHRHAGEGRAGVCRVGCLQGERRRSLRPVAGRRQEGPRAGSHPGRRRTWRNVSNPLGEESGRQGLQGNGDNHGKWRRGGLRHGKRAADRRMGRGRLWAARGGEAGEEAITPAKARGTRLP